MTQTIATNVTGTTAHGAGDAMTPDPPVQALDAAATDAFAGRVLDILNAGALALMIQIGHQTGLFDTLGVLPPSTSAQVAEATGLDERYVREWLAALTSGGIVTYDPATRAYRLPGEHAALLTRAAGPDNLAIPAQYIGLLSDARDRVTDCFRSGGGVGYDAFKDFHRLMAEDSAAVQDAVLVDGVVPLVGGLPQRLAAGIDVADIGCGRGHAVNLLASEYPASRFVGYDISPEAIAAARREAAELGLGNARFEESDVARLDEAGAFDLVTAFDAIHDQAHPATVLSNIRRALRDDGVFLLVDIKASSRLEDNVDHPLGPFLYTISTMHCMTVSLSEGGDGLGTMWGEELALAMLADAGFGGVESAEVAADIFNRYYIARP